MWIRRLWLILLLVATANPANAAAAWRKWCETTAPLVGAELRPGEQACWVHDDTTGTVTDSDAMNVVRCNTLTVKSCFAPIAVDQGATWFYMDASTVSKSNPSPILADIGGGGVDHQASGGDCGDDGDDGTVTAGKVNDSKFYDFTPADRFFWIDEVTAPGIGKTLFVNLVCR